MSEELNELKMIKIMTGAEEKVGLKNYSNVVIGPISVTRFIEDGDDEHIKNELRKNLRMVEELISEIRQEVLDEVQTSKSGYE